MGEEEVDEETDGVGEIWVSRTGSLVEKVVEDESLPETDERAGDADVGLAHGVDDEPETDTDSNREETVHDQIRRRTQWPYMYQYCMCLDNITFARSEQHFPRPEGHCTKYFYYESQAGMDDSFDR